MPEKYSARASLVMREAKDTAILKNNPEITELHVHLALLGQKKSSISQMFEHFALDLETHLAAVENAVARLENKPGVKNLYYSRTYQKLILIAEEIARREQAFTIGLDHLFLALFRLEKSPSAYLIKDTGLEYQKTYNYFSERREESLISDKYPQGITAVLKQYGRDLNEEVELGKIDEVIGMEKEIGRVIQVLCRRMKNNPVIVGEPGVGKTAVVEGLVQRIVRGDVPESLKDRKIFALDTGSLIAGANLRGQFEERLQEVLKIIVKSKGRIILFIDEIHTIVGGGNVSGGHDIANFLKPMLSRGEISAIGATTLDEYTKYVEADKALERRFQKVLVREPSVDETITILRGIKSRYEAYHGLEITDEALTACAKLSKRYISDRYLPDKAIDVMDEACSMQRTRPETDDAQTVTAYTMREVIFRMTGIPIQRLARNDRERIKNLEHSLRENVIGQDVAIRKISQAILRANAGVKRAQRPVGSFLLIGPTGVGKTYLAKQLAKELYDTDDNLIRLDMSEYMEKHSVSKFIGAPPGYIGYEEGGQLTEQIRQNPYSILLLDEIEKAHVEIFHLLLQIMDEGRLTDNKGRLIDFTNTIIIMTSNLTFEGEYENGQRFGSGSETRVTNETETTDCTTDCTIDCTTDCKDNKPSVNCTEARIQSLRRFFKPEFLNRLDEVLHFEPLTRENIREIVDLNLRQLEESLSDLKLTIRLTDDVVAHLLGECDYERYGARAIERLIRDRIETLVASGIIDEVINEGDEIHLEMAMDSGGEFPYLPYKMTLA